MKEDSSCTEWIAPQYCDQQSRQPLTVHVSSCKWMMVIIDQSKAYMTGSANDKCERSQQVDSIIPPLLSQHESPAQHPTVLRGMENTESSPFTTVSFFSSCLCERVRVRPRALAYTQHSCSISSGFSLYYPLKWAQNRIWAAIMPETHCVDSRHFSCKTLKSKLQCNRRAADKLV